MAVADASVSVIVGAANRIDLRAWQHGRIESMGKRRHVSDGGSGGQFILGSIQSGTDSRSLSCQVMLLNIYHLCIKAALTNIFYHPALHHLNKFIHYSKLCCV